MDVQPVYVEAECENGTVETVCAGALALAQEIGLPVHISHNGWAFFVHAEDNLAQIIKAARDRNALPSMIRP